MHRLFLDLPPKVGARIQKKDTALHDQIRALGSKDRRFIDLRVPDETDSLRMYINTKKIGAEDGEQRRRQAAEQVISVLRGIRTWTDAEELDSNLDVHLGVKPVPDGRLAISATVKWPEGVTDDAMAGFATTVMQETAHKLHYERKLIPDLVGAVVDRERGVTLQTNPIGSCSIDTDGSSYNPIESTFEVSAHNIYTSIQQLICFSGAVAIANAAEDV